VDASCSSDVENLAFSVDVVIDDVVIVTADSLSAQANCVDTGGGPSCTNTGTFFTNLCIQAVNPPLACTPISPGANQVIPVNVVGVVTGNVIVQEEVVRTSNVDPDCASGAGLTVTMIHLDLVAVAGSIPIDVRIAEADAFVGCVITTAQFVVNKDFIGNNAADVNVALVCTSGTVVNDDPTASEADPANFTVNGYSAGATCTATETVPAGYTANQSDCVNVDLEADGVCTITNTSTAQFIVNKDFIPDNAASVNVTLNCTSGTVVNDDITASEADPANFTVNGFNAGTTCTAFEASPPGYIVNEFNCQTVAISAGGSASCTITNTQTTAQFVVNKDFVPNTAGDVSVSLTCATGTVTNDDTTASEADPANFTVTGFSPGTVCTAVEVVPGGYSGNQTNCQNVLISNGNTSSCTMVNTQVSTPTPTPTPPPGTPTATPAPGTATPTPGPATSTPTPPQAVGGVLGLIDAGGSPASSRSPGMTLGQWLFLLGGLGLGAGLVASFALWSRRRKDQS